MIIKEWEKDPEFNKLPQPDKLRILSNFFDAELADDQFRSLPEPDQLRIRNNFLTEQGINIGAEFMGEVPPPPDISQEVAAEPGEMLRYDQPTGIETAPDAAFLPEQRTMPDIPGITAPAVMTEEPAFEDIPVTEYSPFEVFAPGRAIARAPGAVTEAELAEDPEAIEREEASISDIGGLAGRGLLEGLTDLARKYPGPKGEYQEGDIRPGDLGEAMGRTLAELGVEIGVFNILVTAMWNAGFRGADALLEALGAAPKFQQRGFSVNPENAAEYALEQMMQRAGTAEEADAAARAFERKFGRRSKFDPRGVAPAAEPAPEVKVEAPGEPIREIPAETPEVVPEPAPEGVAGKYPVLYHGSNAEGAQAIEASGLLGVHREPTFLTPNLNAAKEHARAKGGKVFSVETKNVPDELLEGIETGPVALPPEGRGYEGIPIKEVITPEPPVVEEPPAPAPTLRGRLAEARALRTTPTAETAARRPIEVGEFRATEKAEVFKPKRECLAGECYKNAAFVGLELEDELKTPLKVVHGEMVSLREGKRINHAWIESEDTVYDPTTGVKVPKGRFYELGEVKRQYEMPPEKAGASAVRLGHWGPYTKAELQELGVTTDAPEVGDADTELALLYENRYQEVMGELPKPYEAHLRKWRSDLPDREFDYRIEIVHPEKGSIGMLDYQFMPQFYKDILAGKEVESVAETAMRKVREVSQETDKVADLEYRKQKPKLEELAGIIEETAYAPEVREDARQVPEEGLIEEVSPEEGREIVQPTAEEVPETPVGEVREGVAPQTQDERFNALAQAQRGEPEEAMLRVQMKMGGGVLNPVVEHAGDLTHRMAQTPSFYKGGHEWVKEKVDRVHRSLYHDYGFEREMRENITNNARSRDVPRSILQKEIDTLLQRYADEHRKLTVYNEAQRTARDLAVAVGEQRWDDARSLVSQLKEHTDKGREYWREYALQDEYVAPPVEEVREEVEPPPPTPKLIEWFGRSEVVDRKGKPLPVYHGTGEEIETFLGTEDKALVDSHWISDLGIWLTESSDVAEHFATYLKGPDDAPQIYPLYAKIERPLYFDYYEELEEAFQEADAQSVQEWVRQLQEQGYDGIIVEKAFTDVPEQRQDFVAFESHQVRSVFDKEWQAPIEPTEVRAGTKEPSPVDLEDIDLRAPAKPQEVELAEEDALAAAEQQRVERKKRPATFKERKDKPKSITELAPPYGLHPDEIAQAGGDIDLALARRAEATKAEPVVKDFETWNTKNKKWGEVWTSVKPDEKRGGFRVVGGLEGNTSGVDVAHFYNDEVAQRFADDFREGKNFALENHDEWLGMVNSANNARTFSGQAIDGLRNRGRKTGTFTLGGEEVSADQLKALYEKGETLPKPDEAVGVVETEYTRERAERDVEVTETQRLQAIGREQIPGIRLQEQEEAGKLYEMFERGELEPHEWDKYVDDLVKSGKAEGTKPGPSSDQVEDLQSAYDRGVVAAEKKHGDEVRDYDRVLGGVGQMLRSRGIKTDLTSPMKISDRWHNPLATMPVKSTPEQITKALEGQFKSLIEGTKTHYDYTKALDMTPRYYGTYPPKPNDVSRAAQNAKEAKVRAEGILDRVENFELFIDDIKALNPDAPIIKEAREQLEVVRERAKSHQKAYEQHHRDIKEQAEQGEIEKEAAEAARYTPYTPDMLKKPTAAAIGFGKRDPEWRSVKVKGKEAWTQGQILDLGEPHYKNFRDNLSDEHDPENPLDVTDFWKDKTRDTKKKLPEPFGVRTPEERGDVPKIYFEVEEGLVSMQKRFYDYFKTKYKNATFRYNPDSIKDDYPSPIAVYDGRKIVGLIQPLAQRGLSLEGVKGYVEHGKASLQEIRKHYDDVDKELGAEINEVVEDIKPAAGLSVRVQTARQGIVPEGGFTFSDPETEARYQAAKGAKKDPLLERIVDNLTSLKNKITREYEHLPKTGEFAQLRVGLQKLAKQKGVAADKTLRRIQGITLKLNPTDYDLFTRKVILDDLKEVAAEEKALPFGYTPESLEKDLKALDKAIEGNKEIADAIAKRNRVWNATKIEYINAMDKIGFDVSKKLDRKNYFRHQVLEYVNLKGLFGTGKRLKTPRGRGFLKHRKGSELDINTDYIQAEHEVMAQMLYDIEIAKTLRMVDVDYNIIDQLKFEAHMRNDREIMKFFNALGQKMDKPVDAESLYRQMLNTKQAIGFDKLGKLAAQGELPTGDGQWDWLVDELADNWLENAEIKKELGKEYTSEDRVPLTGEAADQLLRYASWLLKTHGGEPGSGAAATIFKGIREKQQFIKDNLGDTYATWHDLVPEGYQVWQPDPGNVFFMADSIPAALAQQVAESALTEFGIPKEKVRKLLSVGGRRREFVIPDEAAETLNNIVRVKTQNVLAQFHRQIIKYWKIWQLVSPRRYAKYNIRNLSGDADAMFAGNPRAFKKVPQAIDELYEVFFTDRALKGDLKDWFERGGFSSTLQAQEMGEFNDLRMFRHLLKKHDKKKFSDIPMSVWKKYWAGARLSTDFREAVLRYAAYLDYVEEMSASKKGLPKNYGASIPDEIKGIADIKDRAFMMSNDLLGAYDRVGVMGQELRDRFFPFWSWKEVNFRRYYRMFANAASSGNLGKTAARKFGTGAARSTYNITKWLLRATAFWSAVQVWNHTRFPEEEKSLPEGIRYRPHIVLGTNDKGEVITFTRIGALGDLLEWFGLDAAPQYIDHWFKGKMTARDIASDMAKSPVNIIVQGGVPFVKLAGELITRQALFPDVFKRRTIRDRTLHIMRSFGLENEYLAISGKPSRPYRESWSKLFTYTYDPDQSAYGDIITLKHRWLQKRGKGGYGFWITPRGNALYNARLALRYGDKEAATSYMAKYMELGGTDPESIKRSLKGIEQSLMNLNPLYGMKEEEKLAFVSELNAEDRARLTRAFNYWTELLTVACAPEKTK